MHGFPSQLVLSVAKAIFESDRLLKLVIQLFISLYENDEEGSQQSHALDRVNLLQHIDLSRIELYLKRRT